MRQRQLQNRERAVEEGRRALDQPEMDFGQMPYRLVMVLLPCRVASRRLHTAKGTARYVPGRAVRTAAVRPWPFVRYFALCIRPHRTQARQVPGVRPHIVHRTATLRVYIDGDGRLGPSWMVDHSSIEVGLHVVYPSFCAWMATTLSSACRVSASPEGITPANQRRPGPDNLTSSRG